MEAKFNEKVHIMNHPLVAHKLTIMRDENTSVKDFRELVSEIGMLITYEATRDLPLTTKHIKTPICEMDADLSKRDTGSTLYILDEPTTGPQARSSLSSPSCAPVSAWSTACCAWCPPPVWATSACTAMKRRSSRTPTSARCPRTLPSAT